ncbi:helical backbone metal receptor [Sediminibacterium soli]|uniref:helical backbone metal receptor n=1 Tax=Sediminibacterium soli TaxID=2698829 RepID=UPI00137ABD87|nr:helical backbone metal receptor [Sediminibacterium soli]NCI47037.1 ABC transporter substrate-binding protein [Sediminibacterium soli]
MPSYTDQLGNTLVLTAKPQRIISLVPSQTELLYDLGLDKEVIGITKFCVHPEQWFRNKTRIGGTKNIDIEKIRRLQPDLVIANKEENLREQVAALTGIAPVWTSDIAKLDDAIGMIRQLGTITGTATKAMEIGRQLQADFAAIGLRAANRRAVRTAYLIWKDPWMSAGGDTFISDMLQRAGFRNVFADRTRYPEITIDDIRQRGAELVLLSSEPYPFKQSHLKEMTVALPGVEIRLADGEMFSWYGSRLLHFKKYLEE